jgi:hypothetical protein
MVKRHACSAMDFASSMRTQTRSFPVAPKLIHCVGSAVSSCLKHAVIPTYMILLPAALSPCITVIQHILPTPAHITHRRPVSILPLLSASNPDRRVISGHFASLQNALGESFIQLTKPVCHHCYPSALCYYGSAPDHGKRRFQPSGTMACALRIFLPGYCLRGCPLLALLEAVPV